MIRPARLALLVLALALLLALFPAQACCSATIYFDRASERLCQGDDATIYVIYDNPTAWLVGGWSVTITVRASGGNATYGTNYTAKFNGVAFNPDGTASYTFTPYYEYWRQIPIAIHADDSIATDLYQNFTLEVSGGAPFTYPGSQDWNTLYIDKLPTTQFQSAKSGVQEGSFVDVSVIRTGATYMSSSVHFTNANNDSRGSYYTSPSNTISFSAGEVSKAIRVYTSDDGYYGNDYNITITLDSSPDARLVSPTVCNITVNSTTSAPTVQFRANGESVDEGDSARIVVVRAGDVANTVSRVRLNANLSTAAGQYTVVEDNVTLSNYTIVFNRGESEKTITVNASTNEDYDDTHSVKFSLVTVDGGNAVIGAKEDNVLEIVDCTPLPVIQFAVTTESTNEGSYARINVTRTGAKNIVSKVNIAYVSDDDMAVYDVADYKNMIQFNVDQQVVTINVTTGDDSIYGNDYHLRMTLSNASKATIGTRSSNTLTVLDTTPYPTIGFLIDRVSVYEGNSTNLTLVRTGAKNIESTVAFAYNNSLSRGTNILRFTENPSRNVVFLPNETTCQVTIGIKKDDYSPTQAEVAYFTISPVSLASIGASDHAQVEIIDTSIPVPLPPDVYFDGSGTEVTAPGTCDISIKLSANDQESNVIINRTSGTAIAGSDYNTPGIDLPYTVHFAEGDKTRTITVSVPTTASDEKTVVFGLYRVDDDAIPMSDRSTYTLTIHGVTPTPTVTAVPATPTPTPQVQSLYVSANLDTDQVVVGYDGKITITVTNGSGAVSGANVSIDTTGGHVTLVNSTTNANGICYATFRSDNPGRFTLTFTATSSGYVSGMTTLATDVVTSVPGSLAVNIAVKQQPVVTGSEAEVTISVTDGNTPVSGAAIRIEATSGTVTPSSGTTNSDGSMAAMFKSSDAGSYILTVTATASGHPTTRASYPVQVVNAEERHLYATLSVDPQSVGPGSSADVTVTVTDGVMPVSNAQITFTAPGGTITPASGVTDKDGKFAARFYAGSEGTYTLGVTAYSSGIGQASYSSYVKVRQGVFDVRALAYAALAIVIIAILIVLLLTLYNKWAAYDLRLAPRAGAIPADGMSRLPVRIEVFNGFGRPRKVRADTYVELEATAGRIDSVTIPQGKSFADAIMTSSKEFGPVTIRAKLGDRARSTVPVEFTLEGGSLAVTITPAMIIADSKSTASINVRVRNSKGNYVSPLSDKAVELSTTLGTLVDASVTLPARASSANASIISNREGGIATVTATMGSLKGTGRVEFRSTNRQLCENCGQPVPGDADVCPSCGKSLA